MRVILAKMGLDGHDKGLKIISKALRDIGAEVIYMGLRQSAKSIAQTALQEDADAIGISVLSGIHVSAAQKLMDELKKLEINPRVVLGGTIPEEDIKILEYTGISRVFMVETGLDEILGYFKGMCGQQAGAGHVKGSKVDFAQPDESLEVKTESGIPVKMLYKGEDLGCFNEKEDLGLPGEYPYTRGPYKTMYREKVWTMRQYAGLGTAVESNKRYKYLLDQGQTGLSVALDLPTQIGYDSDDPEIAEEVGRVGVAVDTIEDMHTLFAGIPLDSVSVNFTINSTAMIILAMFVVMAEERGYSRKVVSGTTQNDMIKEFLSRNTFIFPLEPSLKIVGDIITYSSEHLPKFNPISCSGYHIRELGANAFQELAFTLGAGITYVEEVKRRGIDVDQFAPRLSFQLSCNQEFFEEIAKFRAARRMWAGIMKERFNAQNEKSYKFRVFSGGNGISLTAQEPLNNIVRGAYQCMAGALGGAQAIHVPAYDEAFAIPTEESALLCLRTQQITAYETGIAKTIDPLAGSYFVENLTNELEKEAGQLLEKIEERGGMVECIKSGWIQQEVINSAYQTQKNIDSGRKMIVGVNKFASYNTDSAKVKIEKIPEHALSNQLERLQKVKGSRDYSEVNRKLRALENAANTGENLFPYVTDAVMARATIGEIVSSMKKVFGEYNGSQNF